MKDGLLMSSENPDGRTLESVLEQLMNELRWKNAKIMGDSKPCSILIHSNNNRIIEHLGASLALQQSSMYAIDSIAPNEGPTGKPRIGEGSDEQFDCFDIETGKFIGKLPSGYPMRDLVAFTVEDGVKLFEIIGIDHRQLIYNVQMK